MISKIVYSLVFFMSITSFSQTGNVGIGTTNPNSSALLDVNSTTKGLLIPRMNEAQKNAIASPATGLLIYQTDNVSGFWYFNGTVWVPFSNAGWSINGNTGTNSTANKVGTTDNQDFILKSNNLEALRVQSDGLVGMGTSSPSTTLHISSAGSLPATVYAQDFESFTTRYLIPQAVTPLLYQIRALTGSGCIETNATNGDVWIVDAAGGTYSGACSTCSGNRAKIRYGGTSCSQNETLVVGPYNATSTSLVVSFNYGFNYDDPGDEFQAFLWNDTTNSLVTSFFTRTSDFENQTYTSTAIATTVGNTYSVRFRYKGTNGQGATVDDVVLTFAAVTSAGLQLVDGNQANGKVLTSDANGVGTWQDLPASVTTDEDWKWISGSGNSDPIYHTGKVNIGTNTPTLNSYNLHVTNGANSGTQVYFGSVEEIRDAGTNMLQFAEGIVPVFDNSTSLGSATNRWTAIYTTDGVINTSDLNLKTAIQPLQYGLNEVLNLNPVSFKWKLEKKDNFTIPLEKRRKHLGFIAQELQQIIPEIVQNLEWKEYEENSGTIISQEMARLGVSYSELVPVLVKAIQEQQIKLEAIKATHNELKKTVNK